MTKEKLFELAIGLVAANISAGQFNNSLNFGTIIHDDTQTAYDRFQAIWKEVSGDPEDPAPAAPEDMEITH